MSIGEQAADHAGCACPLKKFLQLTFKAYYTGRVYGKKASQCIDIIYIDFICFRIKKGNRYG